MKIRSDLINNGESGIQHYPGYLPKLIRRRMFKGRHTWRQTIKKLDPEVRRDIILKMESTKHGNLSDEWLVKELEDWLVDNPEYSFLVEY